MPLPRSRIMSNEELPELSPEKGLTEDLADAELVDKNITDEDLADKDLADEDLADEDLADEDVKKSRSKPGVIYLSRVPPFMKPNKVRNIMSQYGEVGRIFLQPEDMEIRKRRKMGGGSG